MPRPSLEWDMANTIIEDSEPEREAEEERLKAERRQRKRLAKQSKVAIVASHSSPGTPILLKQRSPPSIIEISDPSESISPSKQRIKKPTVASSDSSSEEIQRTLVSSPTNSVKDAIIDLLVRPINLENHISPSKEEATKPSLDLSRFAFPRTHSGKTFTTQGVQIPSMPVRPNIVSSKPSNSTTLPAFAMEFTAQQLNSLLKCVVCDLTWTARKTVPMKMTHIKTCARKNGWADTTVKIRLALLLEQISSCTTTLLEDVVNKNAPKTRKKSKDEAVTTVMDPHDAHQIIIQRAKTLFAQASLDRIREAEDAPATQAFPPTRLGVPGSGFLGSAMEEEHEAPIAGHVSLGTTFPVSEALGGFLPSAFGERFEGDSNPQPTGDAAVCNHEEQARLSFEAEPGHTNLVPPSNSSLRPPSPPFTTLRKTFDVPTISRSINEKAYSPTNFNKKLEDIDRQLAVIHLGSFDNHKKHTTPARQEGSVTRKKMDGKKKERGRLVAIADVPFKTKTRKRSSSRSLSRSRSPIRKSPKPSKSPSKPKSREKQANRYFDDATEETLRQIIMSNTLLYQKILRYEPIHFEQLMQMPALKELNGVGFKTKLIRFLDKHAINFYGDSSLGTQRARYK